MKKIVYLFLAIALLAGCGQEVGQQTGELESEIEESGEVLEAKREQIYQNMKQDLSQSVEDVDQAIITAGEKAVIVRDVLFPVNKEAYDRLFAYLEPPEYKEIEEMREADSILYVEEETKVEVLDIDGMKLKVSIQSSEQEGYIPTKFLEPVSSS